MRKEKTGYLTVTLALILGVLISFIFTIMEAVRIQTIRTQTEGVMEVGLFSVFGEYHRELLQQYHLLYVDTSYGEGEPQIEKSEEHLQYYMNLNFDADPGMAAFSYRDLTGLQCDNVSFDAYQRPSDEKGQVLKRQIVDYMQEKKGILVMESAVKELLKMEDGGSFLRDVEGEWESANENVRNIVNEIDREYEDPETGEIKEADIDNPSEHIKQISAEGILGLAMPPGRELSAASVRLSEYLSRRTPLKGQGTLKNRETITDKISQDVLLREYLFENCGHFHNSKEKSLLKYQIEYLISGKNSDLKNLEKVVKDILHIREVVNIAYIFADAEKVNAADELALLVSMILLTPELREAVKISILYAWSYAESVQDVRILLDGNKVPVTKTAESWNTPLSELLNFKAGLGDYKAVSEGMDYEDYLNFFLCLKKDKQLLYRFMDICEMDIRMTPGNTGFCMDGCIEAVKATANVSSGYGYGYGITRTFSY